jgi:nucleoside-diphosphate-sugar epimerase
MAYKKILITGASGFIGTRFCEKLKIHYDIPYRALVRNFSNASRIARLDSEMVAGDLLEPVTIKKALMGCDAVVHLAHADENSAVKETKNLLDACVTAGIKRFIHISSLAVHGPSPGPEETQEVKAIIRTNTGNTYSNSKAKVELLVRKYTCGGGGRLPGVILRLGVVFGPYSPFVLAVVARARRGEVSVIDNGRGVYNAVYVDDVCNAIHAALYSDEALGKSFFITADQAVTWRDFNLRFATMVVPNPVIHNFSSDEALAYWRSQRPTLHSNLRAFFRLMVSPDFHRQLGVVPALDKFIRWLKGSLKRALPVETTAKLKRLAGGHIQTQNVLPVVWPNEGRVKRELFPIQFSNELACSILEWRPIFDFERGVEVTKSWLEFARLTSPEFPLSEIADLPEPVE